MAIRKRQLPTPSELKRPSKQLVGQNIGPGNANPEQLFRVYQANLLSLISHELRTPLMGIINALGLISDHDPSSDGLTSDELLGMATRNAKRLHESLSMLLDLAALDSGTFFPRLKEMHLVNLLQTRARLFESEWASRGVEIEFEGLNDPGHLTSPVLADPVKLGRAIELCFQLILSRVYAGSRVVVKAKPRRIEFLFSISAEDVLSIEKAWFEDPAKNKTSEMTIAFHEVLQSQEKFLSRSREGLGTELFIVHEILRLHHGVFTKNMQGGDAAFSLELPALSTHQVLKAVLESRIYQTSTGLGSMVLAIVGVPEGMSLDEFSAKMRACLFRASDAVYSLPEMRTLALLMDDCKPEDAPRVVQRIERAMGMPLSMGLVNCPDEASDPEIMIEIAQKRFRERAKQGLEKSKRGGK